MSISVADALSGIKFIYSVVSKVKDNREELLRLTARLEHIVLSLDDSLRRDLIQPQEYIDALTTISNLIERSQRILQRLLKRSLGDRTWNRDEIGAEITRISQDVQNYLSVHTIRTLDTMQAVNSQQLTTISTSVEEIMVKLAEIDIRLGTPPGAPWSQGIRRATKRTIETARAVDIQQHTSNTQITPSEDGSGTELLQSLAAAGRTELKVTGLKRSISDKPEEVTIHGIKANAKRFDILHEIKKMGYLIPDDLHEDKPSITVTESLCEFDSSAPGGLQIAKSCPLIHWWNKYTAYHGLSPATTPNHTIAEVNKGGRTITTTGVAFRFYRTLRVPDTTKANNLPPNLGQFPLLPVSRFSHRLPESVRSKGGFIMPMFQREALWISFETYYYPYSAVKVSVGGVNAISGVAKDSPTPPNVDQDYVVAGLQPWLDGIMTNSGVVRQFVAMPLGQGYTVEEQVTGKAEHGGLQFDIFPRRDMPKGKFTVERSQENEYSFQHAAPIHKTPAELSLADGAQIHFEPNKWTTFSDRLVDTWTLASYRRRINPSAGIQAYYHGVRLKKKNVTVVVGGPSGSVSPEPLLGAAPLGLGAGGKIQQNIYPDPVSPRMYDEENGHRFHVHILSTETWEAVTGVLPPITPITPSTYETHNMPWFSLYDEHMPSLTAVSSSLRQIQSVTQLDEARYSSSSDLINPDHARCSKHWHARASCVFRPCSHLACTACLGEALMKRSCCGKCGTSVTKFVGTKGPVPQVTAADDGEDVTGTAWNISEIEEIAHEAAKSKSVTIIHLPDDRVSQLYSRSLED